MSNSGVMLQLDSESLRPLIEQVVDATVAKIGDAHGILGNRLAFSEPEAAGLLGLHPHQLRDERLRGRIKASVGPGRKILYSREDLISYLTSRRWNKNR